MDTINRIDLINVINEYVFDNNVEPIVDIINQLLKNEKTKKENLGLLAIVGKSDKADKYRLLAT